MAQRSLAPSMLRAQYLPVTLGDRPVLDAGSLSPVCGSGHRAMSPAAKTALCARLEVLVDEDATVHGQSGSFGQGHGRSHAGADDHQIGLDDVASRQGHAARVDGGYASAPGGRRRRAPSCFARMDVAQLGAQHAPQWVCVGGDDMRLDAARAQRCGDLEADEASSQGHRAAGGSQPSDDRTAVGERTERVDVRLLDPRDRGPRGTRARGQQKGAVRVRGPACDHLTSLSSSGRSPSRACRGAARFAAP